MNQMNKKHNRTLTITNFSRRAKACRGGFYMLLFPSVCTWLSLNNYFPFFILFIFLCCSNRVVSIFPPPVSPALPTSNSHIQSYPFLALSVGPLYMFLKGHTPPEHTQSHLHNHFPKIKESDKKAKST